ncbi:HAL/PAL/TAL family ammonia-lyase [[Clostridium] dakarense]|uniref:HAL/PAL/TAL family ammonia-lyase n=1 Tax=Faecalimicrobium dakarense TaxID=1301100 RepID=UPI0004B861CB|nr:aromatic amino acid lyase [[Clostridium] dakarense]
MIKIDTENISLEEFVAIARNKVSFEFSHEYIENIKKARMLVEKFVNENRVIYGITTGFGDNVNHIIDTSDVEKLQINLVRSHACSVGEPLETELVRAIMLKMLLNAGTGYSGLSIETANIIKDLLNKDIAPFVPQEGSVAYLSVEGHIALTLIGEGKVYYKGKLVSSKECFKLEKINPIKLKSKEALSLLNGANSVTGIAIMSLYDSIMASKISDISAALSIEGLRSTIKVLDARLHKTKNHKEQQLCAANISKILKDSEIVSISINDKLQDAISIRSIPQMHGAAKRLINESYIAIIDEMKSCSDNPIILPEHDTAIMGGNFDGSYVGSHSDIICIASCMLAKISERRIDRLTNRHLSNLPAFLTLNPGINNGYMIPQYTASGLYSEMKVLSSPSSIDNVPTCASQEDTVTMAYFAALKSYKVVKKLQYILAIEIMLGIQATDLLSPYKRSTATEKVCSYIREKVPFLEDDRYIYPDMEFIFNNIRSGKILALVEDKVGKIEI